MGADKGGSRSGGGLFHLFDWNKKSRKKLFSNSPENSKHGKRSYENLTATCLQLTNEDENGRVPNRRGSSDYNYASSVNDEDGVGARVPGVVARLMGLESMPTSSVAEPFDNRSRDFNQVPNRGDGYSFDNRSRDFNQVPNRGDGYSWTVRMPSSPIERFQTEMIPPKSAKSLPITHHKLMSPIKNPAFGSARNAAQIMEEAAKIIEPGPETPRFMKLKEYNVGHSPICLKVRDLREGTAAGSQRASRNLQFLKTSEQLVGIQNGRNNTEDIVIFRSSSDPYKVCVEAARDKGKSVSLAVKAKENVQKREGIFMSSQNALLQKESEERKTKQPSRSQLNNQKSKQQRKSMTGNGSAVLRQDNQKQNCMPSKVKSASKQSNSNQTGRKVVYGEGTFGKHKANNKLSGNTRVCGKNPVVDTLDLERDRSLSSCKEFPQKKRLIDRSLGIQKNSLTESIVANNHERHVRPNVVMDEDTTVWTGDKNSTTDVVSFTFTSPLMKTTASFESPIHTSEKWEERERYYNDSLSGLNLLSGDALSQILEQKLREVTSNMEPSCNFIRTGSLSSTISTPEVLKPSFGSMDLVTEHKEFPLRSCVDKTNMFNSINSSNDGQLPGIGYKLQVAHEVKCSNSNNGANEELNHEWSKELNHKQTSPLSILDATLLDESFQSSECSGSTTCQSFVQVQDALSTNCSKKDFPGLELELSDSASSMLLNTLDGSMIRKVNFSMDNNVDIQYVRDILHKRGLTFKNLSLYSCAHGTIDPLLFYKFEGQTTKCTQHGEEKDNRARRKLLFDCVQQCLDLKCGSYFRAGYQAWARGMSMARKDLAEEINEEILCWKRMSDWTVDELVDNDMSTRSGRWVDFDVEVFETGNDIQANILGSLIEEMVADFCVKM